MLNWAGSVLPRICRTEQLTRCLIYRCCATRDEGMRCFCGSQRHVTTTKPTVRFTGTGGSDVSAPIEAVAMGRKRQRLWT